MTQRRCAGAAFFTRKRLDKRSRHIVAIHLGDGQTVRTPGRIAWRRHFEKLDAYATGIEFVDMPKHEQERLPQILLDIVETAGV